MEPTDGRLRAALIAGKISVTDKALAILYAGLAAIVPHRKSDQRDGQDRHRAQERTFPA